MNILDTKVRLCFLSFIATSETNAGNRKQTSPAESSSSVESELDVKIRKGLEKVRKLDKVLYEKMEIEKEVKRSRRAVEQEFQSQVAKLIQEKGADKVCGSQKLLYLCASSDRSEYAEDDDIIEPIFPTQIDAEHYKDKSDDIPISNPLTERTPENRDATENGEKLEKKSKKGRDFVKRNIQLASQAQELIPLTDEEKKRLDELLADDSDLLLVENPFSAPSTSISGYQFSNEELVTLEKIDTQLKQLIPIDEFTLAIGDSQLNEVQKHDDSWSRDGGESSSTRYGEIVIPEGKCGEYVLQEGYDERTVICRLRNIEEKLAQLQFNEEGGAESLIDPDLLRKLLDVDSRLTSGSISICDSLRSKSVLYSDIGDTSVGSESEVDSNMASSQLGVAVN